MLDRLPEEVWAESCMSDLVPQLRHLVDAGLAQGDPILEEVAGRVEALLRETRIPGIPRPDDENWEF